MGAGPVAQGGVDENGLDDEPLSEINVTPLVDVMLVLLIIFMVAAPLMTVGVPVRLPKSGAPKVARQEEPVVVTIDAAGRPFLGKTALDPATMLGELKAVAAAEPGRVVLVRGDRGVPYGRIMEVMGQVGAAGFTKVSLIAEAAPPPAP
jgi:biopolymer transport protein TolR